MNITVWAEKGLLQGQAGEQVDCIQRPELPSGFRDEFLKAVFSGGKKLQGVTSFCLVVQNLNLLPSGSN